MTLDPIALAVPFFFLLIGLELVLARARHRRVYRFTDSFGDLGCGVTQRAVLLLFEASLLAGYALLYGHARLWTFAPGSAWPWVIAVIGVDLAYYWWHRLSHEVNLLWAVHVVHHQSEDYNLAVALRQAVLSPVTVLPFYLPLAVLGVPTVVFFIVNALEHALPVLDPHRAGRPHGRPGERHQHPLASPGAPRGEPRIPGPELRRDVHRLGPALRNAPARGGAPDLRRQPPAPELRPGLGPGAAPGWTRPGTAARTLAERGDPVPLRLAGLASGLARADARPAAGWTPRRSRSSTCSPARAGAATSPRSSW